MKIIRWIRKTLHRALEQVSPHLYWIVAVLAVAMAIFASGLISLVFRGTLNFSVVSTAMVGESLLLAIIACLATIIPIVFSVSTLVIQHAAGNYTASLLEDYKKDPRTLFFYGFLAFGLLFTCFALIIGWSVVVLSTQDTISLLNAAFSILVFSFVLLPFQLAHVTDLINPLFMIRKAKQDCIKATLSTPAEVSVIVRKAKKQSEIERRMAETPLYWESVFHSYQASLFMIPRQKVLQIMDIVFKCAVKREAETYNLGFEAISEIARAYVSIRKEDSTQEDEFLQYVYDKLLSIPKMAFDTGDVALLHSVVMALENVGRASAEIKPASYWGPNFQAQMAMRHISDIGTKALTASLWDSVADAIRSIKNIGVSAIHGARHDGLAFKQILRLGTAAAAIREWFIVNAASGALNDLLQASVKSRLEPGLVPTNILEAIEQLSIFALDRNLEWQALTGLFPIMPENSIERVSWAALGFKNEPHSDKEKAFREGYAWEIVTLLLDVLSKIGIKAAEKKSSMLLTYVAQPIGGIALTLLNEKSTALKNGFDPLVSKAITALATMYLRAERCPLADGLTDALTEIAFRSLDAGKADIASQVVEATFQMSLGTMKWDQYGYDSQRLAGRLGVIGSYAINASDTRNAATCANTLVQFDIAYRRRYPQSKDRRHFEEMQKLHDQEGISLEKWEDAYGNIPQAALDRFDMLLKKAISKQHTSLAAASKKPTK